MSAQQLHQHFLVFFTKGLLCPTKDEFQLFTDNTKVSLSVSCDLNSTCSAGTTCTPAFPALHHCILFKHPSSARWRISLSHLFFHYTPLSSSLPPRALCAVERRVQLLIEPVILMRLIPHVLIELLAFFYFSLRSCASGLISCCRPPLSLSLSFSQSKESYNSKLHCFCMCVSCVCVCVFHVCVYPGLCAEAGCVAVPSDGLANERPWKRGKCPAGVLPDWVCNTHHTLLLISSC